MQQTKLEKFDTGFAMNYTDGWAEIRDKMIGHG